MDHDRHASSGIDRGTPEARAGDQVDTQRLEDLFGSVSHDLKSPLSAIMMTAATLARLPADAQIAPQLRRKAETIQRCAERMAKVIDDLLDLASLQCGRLALETGVHDAAAIVAEAVQKTAAAADERSVTVQAAVADALPAITCDRDRIVQVLSSLLMHAVGVTDEAGAVQIGASRAQGEVVFHVQDGPPGMAPEDIAHALDRGRRGGTAAQRSAALGLTIARGIIGEHGGRVWVEPAREGGSRCSFTVPFAPALV